MVFFILFIALAAPLFYSFKAACGSDAFYVLVSLFFSDTNTSPDLLFPPCRVILLLHVVAAEVTLQIQPQGSVNSSITVRWERKRNDPAFWDLRFSDQAKGLDLDIGLVAATVNVEAGAKRGNVSVVFPKAG